MERALGAIGTTFRLSRLYPPSHPAVVEAGRQIGEALPALAALGTIEWKVGATGVHWQGQHLLPRNSQVAELAGLLYARGVRGIRATPGVTATDVVALFGVATGAIAPNDVALGQLTLTVGRRTQRLSTSTPVRGVPAVQIEAVGGQAGTGGAASDPRTSREFRGDAVPTDVEVKRAIAGLGTAESPEARREAVEKVRSLTPSVLGFRDVAIVAETVAALDRMLVRSDDPELAEAIGSVAGALADKAIVARMVARLGEPHVPPAERVFLVDALAALASLSVVPVLNSYLAAALDLREPYRAVIRRAGDRALEPLQGRLADSDASVTAAAAELAGLTGVPQVVPLLVPLLRHKSEFVREAALSGLAEIGGREISRPVMPALKDPSVGVRAAAARAIAVGGDVAATTVLVRRLEQEDDETVLAELLRAIGRLGAPEAIEALAKYAEPGGMMRRRSPSVRAAAVESLARITSREARGLVELYTHDKEPAVRRAAEAALR